MFEGARSGLERKVRSAKSHGGLSGARLVVSDDVHFVVLRLCVE